MEIYRYYYGAAPGKGIGIRAQSKELEKLPLSSFLKELSSLHALESSEHKGEKLCYLLERDGYSILGLSYPESPRESGYNRAAPCGLQYVFATEEMAFLANKVGELIRIVDFKKPESADPKPSTKFLVDRNHPDPKISPSVLANLVDGLVKVALSKQDILLIALPKGLESEYETARAIIGKTLDYLPINLRKNIRFLTGMPVAEGETKCLTGFENAVRLNANVVFCPNQYFEELKAYRSFIGVNMEKPDNNVGKFASFITQSKNPQEDLSSITRLLKTPGKQSYEELNQAAGSFEEDLTAEKERLKAVSRELSQKQKKQAQAKNKKDIGSSIPDVRTDRRKMDKTILDIDIPASGSGRNKDNSNFISNSNRSLQNTTYGRNYQGADSGRPYSGSGGNGSSQWNVASKGQVVAGVKSRSKTSEETEDDTPEGFFKWFPTFSLIVVVLLACFAVWWFWLRDRGTTTTNETTTPVPYEESYSKVGIKTASTPEYSVVPTQEPTPIITIEPQNDHNSGAVDNTQDQTKQEDIVVPASTAFTDKPISSYITSESDSYKGYRYAITTGKDLKLRPDRSIKQNYLAVIDPGSYVWTLSTEIGDDGNDWTEVYYNGKHGYIMSKFLNFLSQEESEQYNQMQKTPVPQSMYGQ